MTGNLIGISGKLRSGKDTVADHLVEKHGWVKLGMSDALHEAMMKLDPIVDLRLKFEDHKGLRWWIIKHLDGDAVRYTGTEPVHYATYVDKLGYVTAKENIEVRRLLQRLGTEVGREMFGENVWVNLAADKIQALRNEGKNVIITGIRFPNESLLIERLGGTRVLVERPGLEETALSSHASETSIDKDQVDVVIHNDKDLEYLYATVDRLAAIFNA